MRVPWLKIQPTVEESAHELLDFEPEQVDVVAEVAAMEVEQEAAVVRIAGQPVACVEQVAVEELLVELQAEQGSAGVGLHDQPLPKQHHDRAQKYTANQRRPMAETVQIHLIEKKVIP